MTGEVLPEACRDGVSYGRTLGVSQVREVSSGGHWDGVEGILGELGLGATLLLGGHKHHLRVARVTMVGRHHPRLDMGLKRERIRQKKKLSRKRYIQLLLTLIL